jgi:hypothetical protein
MKLCLGLVALAGALAFAQPASATTFCVPAYFAECPNNGSNVGDIFEGSNNPGNILEIAMGFSPGNNDGVADTVMVAPGTYIDADTGSDTGFQARGTDDLTVVGSGRDNTILTSGLSDNVFVVDLNMMNSRKVTLKNLSIVIPETFPDGLGAAVQSRGDSFESVDVITRNDQSNGFPSIIDGGSFKDVRMYGENGAGFLTAISSPGPVGTGTIDVENLSIEDAVYGIYWNTPVIPIDIDGLRIKETDFPLSVFTGANVDAGNVLIESGSGVPVAVGNNNSSNNTFLDLNHATVVATGDQSQPAIRASVNNNPSATGRVEVNVRNSVLSGFDKSWDLVAPASGSGLGTADLLLAYSNYGVAGTNIGDATVNTAANIVGLPGFASASDFHLAPGSLLIDAGDPGNTFLPPFDLDGNVRPADGDGNGTSVRDMGAFELQPSCETDQSLCPPTCETDPSVCPPSTCETDPSLCPPPTCETDSTLCPPEKDKVAPKISKVKFFRKSEGTNMATFRLSEKATIRLVFTPVPKRAKDGKKRKVVKVTRKAKKGVVRITLGKKRLKPGKYRLAITATDQAGNRSKTAKKIVRAR